MRETAKCSRLYNSFQRLFGGRGRRATLFPTDSQDWNQRISHGTSLPLSKRSCQFSTPSQSSILKLHALAFVGLKLRDSASLYSRVKVSKAQVADVKTFCQDHFKVNVLFLNAVNPTVWTLRYAIPHHTKQLFEELGYGLQLD